MITIAEETLGFRRSGFSPDLWLLIPTFSLPNAPAYFTVHLHSIGNAPLPLVKLKFNESTLSVVNLVPIHFRRTSPCRQKRLRIVSCYALFKGWLLLSQPPICLRRNTSFSLSLHFGTLSGDLGCFPCVHEALPSHTHWYLF